MFEIDEGLERFLDEGEPQWFEAWVDLMPTGGVRGVHIRGSEYGHIHFDENITHISQITWSMGDGIIVGSPNSGDALRSLFA